MAPRTGLIVIANHFGLASKRRLDVELTGDGLIELAVAGKWAAELNLAQSFERGRALCGERSKSAVCLKLDRHFSRNPLAVLVDRPALGTAPAARNGSNSRLLFCSGAIQFQPSRSLARSLVTRERLTRRESTPRTPQEHNYI